jgi:exodeoxyribonuclease V alpha subunit
VTEVAIQGTVRRITYENETSGYRVIRLEIPGVGLETIVGNFPKVTPETELYVTGKRIHDPKFGPQILAEHVTTITPQTLEGLKKFLASGIIKGVGERLAARIVDHFGDQTIKILDEGSEKLSEIRGISKNKADIINGDWQAQRASTDALVFLRSHGVPGALAGKIFKKYGANTIDIVQRQPYRLAREVSHIGFLTADRIAQSAGFAADHPERLQAGVVHSVHALTDAGHTFVPRQNVVDRAAQDLGVPPELVSAAVDRAAVDRTLILENAKDDPSEQVQRVYPSFLFLAERHIAHQFHELFLALEAPLEGTDKAMEAFETQAKLKLASAQREAIEAAARYKLLIITGGPGVGKTTIVRALLSVYQQAQLSVKLAAPTGRAAKRLGESTQSEALTIHRLLEIDPRSNNFQRNANHPLDCDVLIVDEASMIDIPLARSLLQALPPKCRLLLVGDVDQLPSVGPGAFLRDLIASERVPCVRLHQIFRQASSSLIIEAAHAIREGKVPQSCHQPDGDFFIIERKDPESTATTIVDLVQNRIPSRFHLDPRRDIQVLAPMYKGGAGVSSLNELLQQTLNPHGDAVSRAGRSLRVGDKVIQRKNDYNRDVFNGDIGFIIHIDATTKTLVVRIDDREITYNQDQIEDLTMAYAISIHKSQGSEYPAVIIPWLRQHYIMLSRNLLYTAVTRGKQLAVIVGDPWAIRFALTEIRKEDRFTSLRERLSDPRFS